LAFPKTPFLLFMPLLFLSITVILPTAYATHSNSTYTVNGEEVPCFATNESQMCGFISNPWNAIKHALFVDYLGDWFVAVVYFPIISLVFILTRNFTYTGLIGMFIVIGTDQAESLPFEISITLIAISAGLAFFEVIRKRVME
jgi:hypothetical protein